MNKKICLIGNNGFGAPVFDGQRIKVRTYKNVFESEGFDVHLVELDRPLKRLFKIFSQIKKEIKECDVVVLITSDNGERLLIPYINRINKKYDKRFVFSQIGTSFLFKHIKDLSEEEKRAFFHEHNFGKRKPKNKVVKNLKKIDVILTETDLINSAFAKFFTLDNCFAVTNFRVYEQDDSKQSRVCENKLIYLSRITEKKGVFDLLSVLKDIKEKQALNASLDIYGMLYLSEEEKKEFDSYLNESVKYCGELNPTQTIDTLKQYDLLCFPTRCEGEGTPGCIVESLIAGTPVLSSNFTQSDELLNNGVDSLIYEFGNLEDMKNKLVSFLSQKVDYQALRSGASKSGEKFTYRYNRDKFLKLIIGESK